MLQHGVNTKQKIMGFSPYHLRMSMKNLSRNTGLNIRAKAPQGYYTSPLDKSRGYSMYVYVIRMNK